MAWEHRNGSYYYYKKQRVGNKVRSIYIGNGHSAELARKAIALKVEKRRQVMVYKEVEIKLDKEIDEVCHIIRGLMYSALLASGYHTHKGQWRKRHNG